MSKSKILSNNKALIYRVTGCPKKGDPCLMSHKGHQKWTKYKRRV